MHFGGAVALVAGLLLTACQLGPNDDPAAVNDQCAPGSYRATFRRVSGGLANLGKYEKCKPCEPGVYCAGLGQQPSPCGGATFDHDLDPSTLCAPKSACAAGMYVSEPGDAKKDRTCADCPAGTYSSGGDNRLCTHCEPGTYCPAGSATPALCADGSWDHDANAATECVPKTPCPEGSYATPDISTVTDTVCTPCAAGTADTDGVGTVGGCAKCEPGTFCPGGASTKSACAFGTWDDDHNPASACRPWTTCTPGTFVQMANGSPTADRACSPCPVETFSAQPMVAQCTRATTCKPGTFAKTALAPTHDRICEPCAENTLTAADNETKCSPPVRAIAAGYGATCGVLLDGTVSCLGQLGPFSSAGTASRVVGLSDVVSVALGNSYGCARNLSGAVACWGDALDGSVLGDATTTSRSNAAPAVGLSGVMQLACAGTRCMTLSGDATVAASSVHRWGYLQPGDWASVPTLTPELANASDLVAGFSSYLCVVDRGVGIRCFYSSGSYTTSVPDIVSAAVASDQVCGVTADGHLLCGAMGTSLMVVPGIENVTKVTAGYGHRCAVTAGQVACWGSNLQGQLGDGTTIDHANPVLVAGLSNVVELASSSFHTCALRADGAVFCWGYNATGQVAPPGGGIVTLPRSMKW